MEVNDRGQQGNRDSQGSLRSTSFIDEIEKIAESPEQLEGTEPDEILQAIEAELKSLGKDIDPNLADRLINAYQKIKASLVESDPYMNDQ